MTDHEIRTIAYANGFMNKWTRPGYGPDLHDYVFSFARALLAAVAPRSCNACLWIGPASEAVMCGSVGPLCPECNETTELFQIAKVEGEGK